MISCAVFTTRRPRNSNLAVASVRPLGTTRLELWLIVRDVLRKLDPSEEARVLDIGCGVRVVGLPLARRARRFASIDIAEAALSVLRGRLGGRPRGPRHAADA